MRRPPSSGPTTNVKLGARLAHSHSVADVGHASDRLQTQVKSPALAAEQQPLRPDGKLELGCDWCGKSFIPRHRSGGSKQKFCSRECQRTSNRERQRTHRRAAYVAPRTTPTISQPDANETPPCEPAVAALHPWQTGVLDITNCQRTEFVVGLNEDETAGTRIETWPAEVRALMDRHVSRWVEENNETRTVRAMTVAAPKYHGIQSCVLILHCSPKG
jgi:predicted nucleic acid-binding Zn ribbon protein